MDSKRFAAGRGRVRMAAAIGLAVVINGAFAYALGGVPTAGQRIYAQAGADTPQMVAARAAARPACTRT